MIQGISLLLERTDPDRLTLPGHLNTASIHNHLGTASFNGNLDPSTTPWTTLLSHFPILTISASLIHLLATIKNEMIAITVVLNKGTKDKAYILNKPVYSTRFTPNQLVSFIHITKIITIKIKFQCVLLLNQRVVNNNATPFPSHANI